MDAYKRSSRQSESRAGFIHDPSGHSKLAGIGDDLAEAAEQGEVREIEGFGEKTEEEILAAIEAGRNRERRFIRAEIEEITDHSKHVRVANGLDGKRLRHQLEEIDALNEELDGIRILKGIEVDILKDGSIITGAEPWLTHRISNTA